MNFSFRGENLSPELVIELDELMKAGQDLSRLHEKLAQANGIDTYSYEFEVMESCHIEFSDASGLARDYLDEHGEFDFEGFQSAWKIQSGPPLLAIAQQHMNIASLDDIKGLEEALMAAYRAGVESRDS